MSEGEICAWHFATRQPVRVRWKKGLVTDLEATADQPPADLWLAPPIFDLQVNGYAGVDFQQDDLKADDLLRAIRQLRAAGCTRFLLTLITDKWPRLTDRLRHLRAIRSQSDELVSAIKGWHIEGPFLSSEPGYHGAHDPALMLDLKLEHIRELRELTGTDPLLLTLAPERKGAIEAIALAVSIGIRISLGHSNSSAEILHRAVQAGATGFTHLGNGCPRSLDRHDNILLRVLEIPRLTIGLIPDRIHVSPPLFRLIHRVLARGDIYYTTDAMAAAGASPGRHRLGALELEVGADQIVRLPGSDNFAGSALKPIEGIFRAAQMLDRPWQKVWGRASRTPSTFMGLPSDINPDQSADFCLLKLASENQLDSLKVYVAGNAVS
jgi:N-acetylglucosamine-6-phosphate deacetylase